MSHQIIGRRFLRFGTISTTMDEAARLGQAGEPEGTVVVAAVQTAGRGRAGRSWVAAPDTALLCSILLRPAVAPDRLPVLSLLIGAAAAEAIEWTTGLSCRLKWPNDLWLGDDDPGRKVGGILLTSRLSASTIDFVVAGIGINVTTRAADLPPGAASLSAELGREVQPDVVLNTLIERLNRAYGDYLDTAGHPDLNPWRRRAALVGQQVTMTEGEQQHSGLFIGIDDDGRLLLQDGQGKIRRLTAGDLTRGPRSIFPG